MEKNRIWWVLRVGAAACFIGHGAFGIITKAAWLPFFALLGIGPDLAYMMMPMIGALDIAAGISILLRPTPAVMLYMTVWAFWTAALRPLTGDRFGEMLERAGNYGVPLALLLMTEWPAHIRGWLAAAKPRVWGDGLALRVGSALLATTVVLLLGHGMLGLAGKSLLGTHYAALGLTNASGLVPVVGVIEVVAAAALIVFPARPLLLSILVWKLATESLFLVAGDPIWEFVERGGSYAAPLALLVMSRRIPLPLPRWIVRKPSPTFP